MTLEDLDGIPDLRIGVFEFFFAVRIIRDSKSDGPVFGTPISISYQVSMYMYRPALGNCAHLAVPYCRNTTYLQGGVTSK